jgi:hypothetical protein
MFSSVEKIVRKYQSHAAAERADRDFYRSLTPQQRLEILLEIVSRTASNEAEQRLERVCSIAKLHKR